MGPGEPEAPKRLKTSVGKIWNWVAEVLGRDDLRRRQDKENVEKNQNGTRDGYLRPGGGSREPRGALERPKRTQKRTLGRSK